MDASADWRASWAAYDAHMASLDVGLSSRYTTERFSYLHPMRLQSGVPKRYRGVYSTSVALTRWGRLENPLVLCLGGVANCAHRFHFLAAGLDDHYQVVCLDWVGRGQSGWLADISEYAMETYIEQVMQCLKYLRAGPAILLGSSLGGTAAILFAARHPEMVSRLILNDAGPYIPAGRRRRRAEALARYYVFRTPADMLRKIGVAQRNDGPVDERVRLYTAHHQTRWSQKNEGRVYRCDPRAMLAYRREASLNVNVWREWWSLKSPILAIHGLMSDALLEPTLRRMRQRKDLTLMHVPKTGHTPVLNDPHQIDFIRRWLAGDLALGREFTVSVVGPETNNASSD